MFNTSNSKGTIMNESTRDQLDAKLKKMLNNLDQAQLKHKEPKVKSGTGNTIRRRKGEKDKRFASA